MTKFGPVMSGTSGHNQGDGYVNIHGTAMCEACSAGKYGSGGMTSCLDVSSTCFLCSCYVLCGFLRTTPFASLRINVQAIRFWEALEDC